MKTTLRDMLSNDIRPGSLLFWKSAGIPVKVVRVEELKEAEGGTKKQPQGKLILELGLTFDASKPEYYLQDFIAVVDPEITRAIANATKDVKPVELQPFEKPAEEFDAVAPV